MNMVLGIVYYLIFVIESRTRTGFFMLILIIESFLKEWQLFDSVLSA